MTNDTGSVAVHISKHAVRITENVKEIAIPSFGTLLLLIHTTNGRSPRLNGDEMTGQLAAIVPPSLQLQVGPHSFPFRAVLDVDIATQMRLIVRAHLELHHMANGPKFCENVFLKLTIVLVDFLIFKFEGHVAVELIPQRFSQSEMIVEIRDHNRFTDQRMLVISRTHSSKTTHSCFGEERARLAVGFSRCSRQIK